MPRLATSLTNDPDERNPTSGSIFVRSRLRTSVQSISSAPPARSPQGATIKSLIRVMSRLDVIQKACGDGFPCELAFKEAPPGGCSGGTAIAVRGERGDALGETTTGSNLNELQPAPQKHRICERSRGSDNGDRLAEAGHEACSSCRNSIDEG